jgi:hypothetical protein
MVAYRKDHDSGKITRKYFKVNGKCIKKNGSPYNLVVGCMRTCNIFGWGDMTRSINGIFLYHIFLLLTHFLLPRPCINPLL